MGDPVTRQEVDIKIDGMYREVSAMRSSIDNLINITQAMQIQSAEHNTFAKQTLLNQQKELEILKEDLNATKANNAQKFDDIEKEQKTNRDWRVKSNTYWGIFSAFITIGLGAALKKVFWG